VTAINGHIDETLSQERAHVVEIRTEVAESVYDAVSEPGDTPWASLGDGERDLLGQHAELYIMAHIISMQTRGLRIIPPGAVARPTSDDEAAAMARAVKLYMDAKNRKGGLVGSVAPKKLILPPGSKLQ
jgi:hypothetical protein